MDITLSQSKIKALEALGLPENATSCPKRFNALYFTNELEREASDMMNKGIYFENLCTGGGLRDREEVPKVKGVDKERIEYNAKLFGQFFDRESPTFSGLDIVEKDIKLGPVELVTKYGEPYMADGIIDLLCHDGKDHWMIDMKITKDSSNTFGPFPWGNIGAMDTIQLYFYKKLLKKVRGLDVRVAYLLFDISPSIADPRFIEITHTEETEDRFEERVADALHILSVYMEGDWGWVKPSFKDCGSCNLECPFRDKINFKHESYKK